MKDNLFREFELETNRSQNYFSYMYKIIQFTFVAIVAIAGFSFSLLGDSSKVNCVCFIGLYLLPIVFFVFGTMYTYNAYAITISGKRAQELHKMIYDKEKCEETLKEYHLSDKRLTIISYGVTLAFYILSPLFCYILVYILFGNEIINNLMLYVLIPIVFLICYYIILTFEIISIIKNI